MNLYAGDCFVINFNVYVILPFIENIFHCFSIIFILSKFISIIVPF